MIGVVSHQCREVECHRQASLAMREQELVALICVAGTPEPSELAHRPELAAIASRMNSPGVRENAWSTEVERISMRDIERRVKRRHVACRIGERDVSLRRRFVLALPLSDLGTQPVLLRSGGLELTQRSISSGINRSQCSASVTRCPCADSSSSAAV